MVQSVSSDQFRMALANFAAGVTVVTSLDAEHSPVGATVSAFTSVSADPPMVLVCLKSSTRTAQAVSASDAFTVHVLSKEQSGLAQRFATDQADKFTDLQFRPGSNGCPAITECRVRLECIVDSRVIAGSHTVLIGAVQAIHVEDIDPLIYANRTFGEVQALRDPLTA